MARPPEGARDVPPPVGGVSYQLHARGALWMHVSKNLGGQVTLGWPMNACDFANVVSFVLQGNKLRRTIRKVDERAGSTPGTDDVLVVSAGDPPTPQRVTLAVPPGGPTWATLERVGARHRVLDPDGASRLELEPAPNGLAIRAFDERGELIVPQPYLMV